MNENYVNELCPYLKEPVIETVKLTWRWVVCATSMSYFFKSEPFVMLKVAASQKLHTHVKDF